MLSKEEIEISVLKKRVDELEYLLNNRIRESLKIEVYDKVSKTKHIVGTNIHDCLLVENGKVIYCNLQNDESTKGDYEFVEKGLHDETN